MKCEKCYKESNFNFNGIDTCWHCFVDSIVWSDEEIEKENKSK